MKKIRLGGKKAAGKVAIVSDEDYAYLSRFKWSYCPNRGGYAVRRLPKAEGGKILKLCHAVVDRWLGPAARKGKFVDHRNGCSADDRRENLRVCSHHENQMNVKKSIRNTTGFKGVILNKSGRRYAAQVHVDKYPSAIHSFAEKRQAALAYDLWAADLFGEFACTNFPIVLHSNKKKPAA